MLRDKEMCLVVMSKHAFLWRFPVKAYLLGSSVRVK